MRQKVGKLYKFCHSKSTPKGKSPTIIPNSDKHDELLFAMNIAKKDGYLYFLVPNNSAITNYYLSPAWMKDGVPSLLTGNEIQIIQTHVGKYHTQDLTTLTFDILAELLRNGLLKYRFPEHLKYPITECQKLGIVAAYTNMLKTKYEKKVTR